jgi:hypothetical protein
MDDFLKGSDRGMRVGALAFAWCVLVFLLELVAERFMAPQGVHAILFGLMAFGILAGGAGVLRSIVDQNRARKK